MGFLDRLLGREERSQAGRGNTTGSWGQPQQAPPGPQASEDERALARYQYLLRTAPPDQIERVHAEAFEQLTPEQRQQVLQTLSQNAVPGEAPTSDQPQDLARAATRAEMRQPGTLQRSFAGSGMGGMFAGSMLGTIAGFVIGSAIAGSLLGGYESSPEADGVGEGDGSGGEFGAEDAGYDSGGAGADSGGDFGGDFGGGDFGGDFGGGDFGGF